MTEPNAIAMTPWRVSCHEILDATDRKICGMTPHPNEIGSEALIVAAPDLFLACERALTFLTMGHLLGDESRAASLLDTLDKLRAALEKAGAS